MENKALKPNLYILLGSVTLGASGAFSINYFRKKKEPSPQQLIESPDKRIRNREMSFTINQDEFDTWIIKGQDFKKLRLDKKQIAENDLAKELKHQEDITCEIERVQNLVYDLQLENIPQIINPMLGNSQYRSVYGGEGFLPESAFISLDCFILQRSEFGPNEQLGQTKRWLRAGPRKHLFFNPKEVKAAIMVGGGLCPGINVIIRELVMSLWFNYRVEDIIGIKYGFKGFQNQQYIKLNPDIVSSIHQRGGSFLGTARQKFNADLVLEELIRLGINQFYVIGGMGTILCLHELGQRIKERNLKISVVGIPKSQDNDIPIIDKSFGFETGVEAAQNSIEAAYSETHSRQQCVGIVRVNGRKTGFMAMHASIASRCTNICLVPEFRYDLYGERGLLEYVHKRLQAKGSCIIVTSYGSVDSIRDLNHKKMFDASGNVKFEDIGLLLKQEIQKYSKEKNSVIEVKYLDPMYLIRAGKTNALDTKMGTQLAQNAVHGANAGFTQFVAGHVCNKTCYIPLVEILSGNYVNRIQSTNINWQRLLASTGQPSFINDEAEVISAQDDNLDFQQKID